MQKFFKTLWHIITSGSQGEGMLWC